MEQHPDSVSLYVFCVANVEMVACSVLLRMVEQGRFQKGRQNNPLLIISSRSTLLLLHVSWN